MYEKCPGGTQCGPVDKTLCREEARLAPWDGPLKATDHNLLRELRHASGLTRPQVAEALGISVGHLYKLEEEMRPLKVEHARALAALYGVGVEDVLRRGFLTFRVGTIEGDGRIKLFPEGSKKRVVVKPCRNATEKTVAVQVVKSSLGFARMHNCDVYYDDVPHPTDCCLGRLCVVWPVPNGDGVASFDPIVCEVYAGTKTGLYMLITLSQEKYLDVELIGASKVRAIEFPE